MSTRRNSKNNVIGEVQEMIAGLQKHLTGQTMVLGGTSIAVTDLVGELTDYVAQINATSWARGAWIQQVLATRTLETSRIGPLRTALSLSLEGRFGPSAGVLTDFGIQPRKKPQRTVANKAEAIEKNVATRAARGTKGSRQKASIHGTVPPAPTTPEVAHAADAIKRG